MKPDAASQNEPDPDFDGHVDERVFPQGPLNAETFIKRLEWAWQGTLLLNWAKRVREESGLEPPSSSPREEE